MTFKIPAMLIDRVDDHDHVIGRIQRSAVFNEKANFRVVHILVRNHAGDILLEKIAPGLRHADAWGSSVAGYVKAGETYRRAALRKLEEELGIRAATLKPHGRSSMLDEGCKKFIAVYSVRHDGLFRFASSRATGLEFLSIPEIVASYRARRRTFTPTFIHVLRHLVPDEFRARG